MVADAGEVLAEFEEKLDREDPALVAWEPTRMALGYTPDLGMLTNRLLLKDRFVAMVKVRELATLHVPAEDGSGWTIDENGNIVEETPRPAYDRVLPLYAAIISRMLYTGQRMVDGSPVLLEIPGETSIDPGQDYVPPADSIWIPGHYYLLHGSYAESSLMGASYMQLSMGQYELDGVDTGVTDVLDVTQPDGTPPKLDGSTGIEKVAQTYQVTTHSLTVQATDRPADLLPFQQGGSDPGRGRILYRRRQGLPDLSGGGQGSGPVRGRQSAPVPGGAEEYPDPLQLLGRGGLRRGGYLYRQRYFLRQ